MAEHVVVMPRFGVPPDIQYYLDCSISSFHLPPDVWFWCRNFCTNVTQLIDGFDRDETLTMNNGRHMDYLQRCGLRLEQLYLQWQKTACWEQIALCLGYGVVNEPTPGRVIAEAAHGLVDHLDHDPQLGLGVLFELADYNRDVTVYEDSNKRMYSARRKLMRHADYLNSLRRMYSQWNELTPRPDFSQFQVQWPDRATREQLRAAVAELPYEDGAEIVQEHFRQRDAAHGRVRKTPSIPKETRKAIVRSSNLLDAVAGEGTTRLFLSGKELRVTGSRYEFSLSKSKWGKLAQSHGTCETQVYDVASGELIASLCVYTKDVTVFDHLASIVMHCKSGQDHLVLEEANVIQGFREDLLPESKQLGSHQPGIAHLEGRYREVGRRKHTAIQRQRQRLKHKAQRKLMAFCYGELAMPRVTPAVAVRRLVGEFYGPELE